MNKLIFSFFMAVCFVVFLTPSVFGQTDTDGDGIVDQIDNCPTVSNPNQANSDAIIGLGTWLMNENSGTTITAIDGFTAATLTNSPQWVMGRNGGSALQFNGSNQYASATLPLNGKSNATIATWIKTSVGQGSKFIVSVPRFSSGFNGFDIGLAGSGTIRACSFSATGAGGCASSNQTYADGQWHHLAATYDGLLIRLYFDGNQVATLARTGPLVTDSDLIQIGRFGTFGAYYNGVVDEVFITDRTLTANEITILATQGFSDNQGDACDNDDDNDGVLDVNDGCPLDKNKIAPGLCGCGQPETCPYDCVAITAQTLNSTQNVGDLAAFNVTVTGSPTITYRWFKTTNLTATLGTAATFSIPSVSLTDAGNYQCEISNNCGTVISATANLTVVPSCTTPPAPSVSNLTYCAESQAQPLTAIGTNLLWYAGATGGTGSTTAPVPITLVPGLTSYYVSQTVGTCESPRAVIQVLVKDNTITLNNQSGDLNVAIGQAANFFVSVLGAGPFTYRWFNTDEPTVTLGTNATFTIPSVSYSDIGGYRCEITNDCDFVWSNVVALCTPLPAPYVGTPFAFAGCGNVGAKAQRRDANFAPVPNLTFEWYEYDANGPDNRGAFIQSQTTTVADPVSFYNWNPAPTSTIQVKKVVVYENLNNCYSPKSEIELTVFPQPANDLTITGLTTNCAQININAVPTTPFQSFQGVEWWKNGGHDVLPNLSVTPNFMTTDVSLNFVFAFKTEFRPHVAGDLTCYSDPLFVDININPLPTVSITNLSSNYCKNAAPTTLTGLPIGGNFTIDGTAATILDPSVLTVGNHAITYNFTDANGCANSANQTVVINALPTVNLGLPQQTCIGQTLTFTATTTGGMSPYTYLWNNGSTTNTLNVTASGNYRVTVTDANGCSAIGVGGANFIPLSNFTNNVTFAPACPTDSKTLTANLNFVPTNYNWNTGATTSSIIVVGAGNFSVTATNTTCQSAVLNFVIPDSRPNFTLQKDDPDCYRERGTITVSGTPNTGIQYRRNGGSWQTSAIFSNLQAGKYVIDVRRTNAACWRTDSVTIAAAPPRLVASVTKMNISCNGANDGKIQAVNVSGGTTPYQFSLDSINWQSDSIFRNLSAGIYKLFIRDANSCILVKTNIQILDPSVLTLVLDSIREIKCNGAATGRIYTTGTGGTGNKMYSKNNGTTWQSSSDFTNLPSGTYNLLVKDANNCLSNAISTTLNEPSLIVFSTAKTNETCNDANNGTITITASGGVNPYEYSRNNGSTYQISSIFTGLAAGNYALKVRDANGCATASQTVSITQPTAFSFVTVTTPSTCNGIADAKIVVRNYSGGNGGLYQFSKDNGANYQVDSVFSGLSAGNYFVKIRDVNGCESLVRNLTVTQPAPVTFATVVSDLTCGATSNGVIGITTVAGGTPQYKYSKNGGTTFQNSNAFVGLPVGTYPIQVKDSKGCLSAVANSSVVNGCPTQDLRIFTPSIPTQLIPIVIHKLSPNPTEGELNLEVNSLNIREQQFSFYDILGKQVQTETRTLEQGINRLTFDCSALPQGAYLIITPESVGSNQPRKFIKL